MTLSVPEIANLDTLSAALAYARAGWYVIPIESGGKRPAAELGRNWPEKSSRDPAQITAWFAGTNYGVGLHVGRSGAIAFDVDRPEKVPDVLRHAIDALQPPQQQTRASRPERGHYIFGMPPGRVLGNGAGRLGGEWGEVRGLNGQIVVAPTPHVAPDGMYRWRRVGAVPTLPSEISELLHDAVASGAPADGRDVIDFINTYNEGERCEQLDRLVIRYTNAVEAGESRHESLKAPLVTAFREAKAGLYPARDVHDTFYELFITHAIRDPVSDKQGAKRTPAEADAEFASLVRWAVGEANRADDAETLAANPTISQEVYENWVEGLPAIPARTEPELEAANRVALQDRIVRANGRGPRRRQRPLIQDMLNRDTVAGMFASAASFKTFVTIEIAASIATGRDLFGELPVVQGPILYIVAEGEEGFVKRLDAWEKHNGCKLPEEFQYLPEAVQLFETTSAFSELMAYISELHPHLIVIDTLARSSLGAEENSAKEMGRVIENLDLLKRASGACVLFIHHVPKYGVGPRGSSALSGAVDTEIKLSRVNPRENWQVDMESTKSKDSAEFLPWRLTLESVDLDYLDEWGRPVNSLVVADAVQMAAERRGGSNSGPTDNHWQIAAYVARRGVAGMNEIARAVGVSKSAVQAAARHGLIQRREDGGYAATVTGGLGARERGL